MDVFGLRDRVISDYSDYVRSFIRIKDSQIAEYVKKRLEEGRLWPDPLIQLNPALNQRNRKNRVSPCFSRSATTTSGRSLADPLRSPSSTP